MWNDVMKFRAESQDQYIADAVEKDRIRYENSKGKFDLFQIPRNNESLHKLKKQNKQAAKIEIEPYFSNDQNEQRNIIADKFISMINQITIHPFKTLTNITSAQNMF